MLSLAFPPGFDKIMRKSSFQVKAKELIINFFIENSKLRKINNNLINNNNSNLLQISQ